MIFLICKEKIIFSQNRFAIFHIFGYSKGRRKEVNNMATQSIFHNIMIKDSKTANAFISALENSAHAPEKARSPRVSSRDMTKEEIKKYFGVVQKTND